MRFLVFFALVWPLQSLAQAPDPHAPDSEEPAADSEDEGRALFADATAAYEDGRYRDALGLFQRLHELTGRVEFLFNVGLSHQRLGELEEARDSYGRYLVAVPSADNRDDVEARVREIDALLDAPAPAITPADLVSPAEPETSRGPVWLGIAGSALVAAGGLVFALGVAKTGRIEGSMGREWSDAEASQRSARNMQITGAAIAIVGAVTACAAIVWALVRPEGSQEELAWHF